MWKTLGVIVFVLWALLALGLAAEEPATIVVVLPPDGGVASAQVAPDEKVAPYGLPPELFRRFELLPPKPGREAVAHCLAGAGGEDDACSTGEQLSRMKPCLVAEDCEAVELWEKRLGELGSRRAVRPWPTLLLSEDKQ